MCHRKFTMDFGRRLNYISGRNGSGKSAIAVALQICLGATARNTGRGKSIVSYIREGTAPHQFALISVTLRNEGCEAYLPDIYGEKIIVERKITKEGSGGYVLKNEHGNVISRERKDLMLILTAFNIQVDNPCCVLTQEESKQFIQGSDKEKYSFFMKATGLSVLSEQILAVSEDLKTTENEIDRTASKLAEKKKDVKKWSAVLEKLKELESIDVEIGKCYVKAAWCEAMDCENEVAAAKEKCDICDSELLAMEESLAERSRAGGGEERLNLVQQQQKQVQDEMDSTIADKIHTCLASVQESNKRIAEVKNNLSMQKEARTDFKRRLNEENAALKGIRDRQMVDAQQEERDVLEGINNAVTEIDALNKNISRMNTERNPLLEQRQGLLSQLSQVEVDVTNSQREVKILSDNLKEATTGQKYSNSSSNTVNLQRLRRFGNEDAVKLAEKISKERFNSPPIGPLGMHITMKDGFKEWELALEKTLGYYLLSGYVVTNREDSITLKRLMNSVSDRCNFTVYQQPDRPRYDVRSSSSIFNRSNHGNNGIVCAIDLLQISNDLVFNTVVDYANVENVVYSHSEDDIMRNLVQQTSSGGKFGFKYDIKTAMTQDGTTYRYTYGLRSMETNRGKFNNLLAVDNAAVVETLQESLRQEQHEFDARLERKLVLKRQVEEVVKALQRLDNNINNEVQNLKRVQRQKHTLDNRLLEVQDLNRVDTTNMEAEIIELTNAIEQADGYIAHLSATLEEENRALKAQKAEHKLAENQRDEYMRKLNQLSDELAQILAAVRGYNKVKEALQREINKCQGSCKEAQKVLENSQLKYEKLVRTAEDESKNRWPDWDGQPIPLTRKDTRAAMIKLAEDKIRSRESDKRKQGIADCTIPIALDKYNKAMTAYQELKTDIEEMKVKLDMLNKDVVLRTRRLNKLRIRHSNSVMANFEKYLTQRNSSGSVKFDFDEQTMTMVVQTQKHDGNTQVSDVKNLSGGERSFATFCFLLALGHVIESSFRVMDEWDVFMDELTRKETIMMMEYYIERPEQKGRQFILLTPNNLSHVSVSNKVRVKKLPDPVNHQSAHGLQQQTIN